MANSNIVPILRLPGTGPGTGPIIGDALPSLGVDDWVFRFDGSRLVGASGAAYTDWDGIGSSVPDLTMTLGGATATVEGISPDTYLHTVKTTGAAMELIGSGDGIPAPFTLAALVRVPNENSQDVIRLGGCGLKRAADGRWQGVGLTSGAVTIGAEWSDGIGWRFVMMSLSGTTLTVRTSSSNASAAVEGSGTVTPSADAKFSLRHPGDTGDVDFAIVAAWDRALSAGERLTVNEAFLAASALL